jgi:hypothetical protein
MSKLLACGAQILWAASNFRSWLDYRNQLASPHTAQKHRLEYYIKRNSQTAFGKLHCFDKIQNYGDFIQRVPLGDYDSHSPWIERVRWGEAGVVTEEPIIRLVPTSGTTSAKKHIPFCESLQREFGAGVGAWLMDLLWQEPGILGGPHYWSITPAMNNSEVQDNGSGVVPVGFDDDTEYLGGFRKKLVQSILAVPTSVQEASSLEAFQYATLLFLLRCRDLRLISVWHPSFLIILLEALPAYWDQLLSDIRSGTFSFIHHFPEQIQSSLVSKPHGSLAQKLRGIGPHELGKIWPKLRVISCWGDGMAASSAGKIRTLFPGVMVQEKGLLATEALVTIPFSGKHPLAITSHFFEFLDESGNVFLAGDLKREQVYEVVVTTGGGLWRYRLGDRVQVDGFIGATPSLKFLERTGGVSDRFGEKLSETFVNQVLDNLLGRDQGIRFVLLAPEQNSGGFCYTLYLEGTVTEGLGIRLDEKLSDNPHYKYARRLGQLQVPRIFQIERNGYESFAGRLAGKGTRLGDIKPTKLSKLEGWRLFFEGKYTD